MSMKDQDHNDTLSISTAAEARKHFTYAFTRLVLATLKNGGTADALKDECIEAYIAATGKHPKLGELFSPDACAGLVAETLARFGQAKANAGADRGGGKVGTTPARRATVILRGPNELAESADEIQRAVAADRGVFTHAGVPVTVRTGESAHARVQVRHPDGTRVLDADGEPVTKPAITCTMAPLSRGCLHKAILHAASLHRWTEVKKMGGEGGETTEWVLVDAGIPASLMTMLLDTYEGPVLRAVSEAPVMFRGKLRTGNGYDPETRLWMQTGDLEIEPFGSVEEAWEFLRWGWLTDFPFDDESDAARITALGGTLLSAKTTLYGEAGPPGHLVTAWAPSIGKSLLLSLIYLAVNGSLPGSVAYTDDAPELRKLITTLLMGGSGTFYFDNWPKQSSIGTREHAILAKYISEVVWSDRMLGLNRDYTGVAWAPLTVSGISIIPVGEIASRLLVTRLSRANTGNSLTGRKYAHPDIVRWTIENRARILGAFETILAQKTKERDDQPTRFPAWHNVVGARFIAAACVTDDEFYADWSMAADEDTAGHAFTGLDPIISAIAALDQRQGAVTTAERMHTPAELIEKLDKEVFTQGLKDGEVPTGEWLTAYLRKQIDCTGKAGGKLFILRGVKMKLGERTGYKVRWVFYLEETTAG